ncbi:MAG: ATP-dependent helicase HrpB [Paludibacteraceae bacterium]|nr:ATP-dependent helicase HrpB [Paludibacteraceae bacterium]
MGNEYRHLTDVESVRHLPAFAIAGEVNQQLKEHNRLVVTAAPGAGKSTLLPLTLLDSIDDGGKILMLEPRRLAAKQIAERMADLLHDPVGQTVGYRVRFEKKVSSQTRIEVLTEGILSRMLVNDPMLEGVSIVIFDEFHERSLPSDVALALTREAQQVVRPDLRIVLMSATIDASAISKQLQAPVVNSEGRMFPVNIIHTNEEADNFNVAELVARTIRQAHAQEEGDILAFLPGQGEILRCQELLGTSLGNTAIYPLYGLLPPQEQKKAIMPSANGGRKVVLATSIAETSLTIEGVRIVVDSGLCRSMVFDQRNGLSHMTTQRISLDMATQRAGRAGRLAPGCCYRLWTLATEHRMEDCRTPEILNADLAPVVLDVAAWGESDISRLPWLTPPPTGNVAQAERLLKLLGATDTNRKITTLGKTMAEMPCHPRIARMLALGQNNDLKALAADVAALIEEKDPLAGNDDDADISTRIALLRNARQKHTEGKWSRIAQIAREYRTLARVEEDNSIPDPIDTGALIATAYPERVAAATDNCGHFRTASGDTAVFSKNDQLAASDWVAIATMNTAGGRVFLAAPLHTAAIQHLLTQKNTVAWDNKQGRIVAQQEKRIGCLVVEAKPLHDTDRSEIISAICQAATKEGNSMFDFNDEVGRLQRRVACVAGWHPELELPNLSTDNVLARADEWLPFFLDNNGQLATSTAELKKIDLVKALTTLLTYEQQLAVDRLAPTHITVPTGSRIRIDYRQGAEAPVLCVRLQECFGLTETPCVNDGKQPVLMELLSPGFKPVQLTQDLRSFWNNTYFEVRKELKRRYPKHYWPDNPLEAEATRGVNKHKNG